MTIEPKLIEDCIKGKRSSQNELYKLTYRYLMSICIRYTHNQDRANETLNLGFFKILKYLNTYRTNEPFKPWIRKVMINTLIKEYKKEKSQKLNLVYVEDYHDSEKYSELNSIMDKINSEQIYKFIAMLPPASRQVFNLYFIDGYKHREIADMLDFSEGTSKWHLNSAREKLKEMILRHVNSEELNVQKALNTHE
ncbi:MAG: RNA polymerase sigma factor [Bacteroidia bacterium]|nr:RNA polymerase sigma factor [Bacteroidia bacterium]